MLNINDVYKNESEYLKASEIPAGQKFRLTIKQVGTVTFNEGQMDQQIKLSMGFEETEKKLTINKTNGMVIAHVLGDDAERWVGNKIFLYSTLVPFGEKMVPAIRVEMPMQEAIFNQQAQTIQQTAVQQPHVNTEIPKNLMKEREIQQPENSIKHQPSQQDSSFSHLNDDDIPF